MKVCKRKGKTECRE